LSTLGNVLVAVIVMLHFGFLVLEMFFWTKPIGLDLFGQTKEQAQNSAALAANQGLYNGFLAAGLILALGLHDAATSMHLKVFFLLCILIAGLYAGATVKARFFLIQGLPALVALLCFWVA
jgi:putative membrane protein